MQGRVYRDASRPLLAQAMGEWESGDLRQASEKGWGAAAQVVKAVAEQRGWQHNNHRLLHQIMGRIVNETGDQEISTLFLATSGLHTNFYEDAFPSQMVRDGLQDVGRLLDKLDTLFR